jgi:hypothetical protein
MGPSRLSPFVAILFLFVIGVAGVIALAVLTSRSGNDASTSSSLTVDDVFARMGEAMTSDGQILHMNVTRTIRYDDTAYARDEETEIWLDFARDAAHITRDWHTLQPPSRMPDGRTSSVLASGSQYFVDEGGKAQKLETPGCDPTGKSTMTILHACYGARDQVTTQVVPAARYEGRHVLSLRTDGRAAGIDTVFEFREDLFIDPRTYLPLAVVTSGTLSGINVQEIRETSLFRHEFVARTSVAENLFDPSSVGYVAPEARAPQWR